MENTSGQGSQAIVPKEVMGWNWGAFCLTWTWGIGNHVRLALIVLIPLAGFIVTIVVGRGGGNLGIGYDIGLALFLLMLTMLIIGFIMAIVLGMKGSKWAWRKKRWDSIEHFRRTQRTWANWGKGLLLAGIGLLYAAITITNMPWGRHPGTEEASLTELHNIQTAVRTMMAENNLDTIPNPVGTATKDMGAFPDVISVVGSADKLKDTNGNIYGSGDKNGYLLYGHDMTGDNNTTTLVNYVLSRYTKGTYTVNSAGNVTQVTFDLK